MNPFGITVTSSIYADAGITQAEVVANLTDAFDTFGVCKKKVGQISDRILSLAAAGKPAIAAAVAPSLPHAISQETAPPSYAQRAGPSLRGKAVTGLILSIAGILVGPVALAGVIMCTFAANGMATSSNKEGRGAAIAGVIIGFIALIGWFVILMSR